LNERLQPVSRRVDEIDADLRPSNRF